MTYLRHLDRVRPTPMVPVDEVEAPIRLRPHRRQPQFTTPKVNTPKVTPLQPAAAHRTTPPMKRTDQRHRPAPPILRRDRPPRLHRERPHPIVHHSAAS